MSYTKIIYISILLVSLFVTTNGFHKVLFGGELINEMGQKFKTLNPFKFLGIFAPEYSSPERSDQTESVRNGQLNNVIRQVSSYIPFNGIVRNIAATFNPMSFLRTGEIGPARVVADYHSIS